MTFNQAALGVIHDASRRLGKVEVEYTPVEYFQNLNGVFQCVHPETHSEEVLRSMAGSYDNPHEDMILVSVCDSCDEVVEDF